MKNKALPRADVGSRPGVRTEVTVSAFDRWNADVQLADTEKENSISILDVIGQDFWGEGVTAKRVAGALRAIGNNDVTVSINSPGGDYFEGLAIYNMLRDHPAKVTVKVLGIAASAASVIAMAGDEIQIARAGFLMIHNTWVVAMGDRHALRDVAAWLEPFDNSAIDIYSARTGMDAKTLGKMLDRETWIGGSDAVDQGFADALLSSDELTAKNSFETQELHALRELEMYLAKANCPRSRRGDLVAAMKGGLRDAAATDQRDAVVINGIEDILNQSRSIKGNEQC